MNMVNIMGSIKVAKWVLKDLQKAGYEAYIVGGAVRDHILKLPLNDIDITTNAKPYQVAKLFKTKPTGIKYGTVTVFMQNETFEVTTYRIDGEYKDFRHPDEVVYSDSVIEDVKRRDFRINGLLMNEKEVIIDHVEGLKDIQDKRIRTIGNPDDRFHEDALRMLRAIYFQAKLGFQIDKETRDSISKNKDKLKNIAMERNFNEIIKILKGKYAKRAIKSLATTGIHSILPGLEKGINYMTNLEEVPFVDAFFTLCFALEKEVPKAWPFSNKHRHKYEVAVELINKDTPINDRDLFTYGLDICLLANKVSFLLNRAPNLKTKLENDFNALPLKSELDLKLRGQEIVKLTSKKPGAWLSALQREMVDAILEQKLKNEKETLSQYVIKRVKEQEKPNGTQ
jgi:tRNA nucleotidyltransferase (CCA-adding enzyme)